MLLQMIPPWALTPHSSPPLPACSTLREPEPPATTPAERVVSPGWPDGADHDGDARPGHRMRPTFLMIAE